MIVLYLILLSLTTQRDVLYQNYIISPAFNWSIVLVFNQNIIFKKITTTNRIKYTNIIVPVVYCMVLSFIRTIILGSKV